jgi:hypothetical protein
MLGLSSRTLRELAAAREEIAQLEELADARAEILRLKERIAANIVADGDDDTVVSQMPARATNTPRKLQPMPPSAPRSTVSALSAQPPRQLAELAAQLPQSPAPAKIGKQASKQRKIVLHPSMTVQVTPVPPQPTFADLMHLANGPSLWRQPLGLIISKKQFAGIASI